MTELWLARLDKAKAITKDQQNPGVRSKARQQGARLRQRHELEERKGGLGAELLVFTRVHESHRSSYQR